MVQVTTRAGRRWTAAVVRVLWTDGRVSICVTREVDGAPLFGPQAAM